MLNTDWMGEECRRRTPKQPLQTNVWRPGCFVKCCSLRQTRLRLGRLTHLTVVGLGRLFPLEEEQRQEWYALEEQATALLRGGNTPRRSGVRQLLQVLVLPSFEAATSWEMCHDVKATNPYFAVKSVWRKDADLAKLETPVVRLQHPRPLVPTIAGE